MDDLPIFMALLIHQQFHKTGFFFILSNYELRCKNWLFATIFCAYKFTMIPYLKCFCREIRKIYWFECNYDTWYLKYILYNIILDVSSNEFCKAISVGIQGILRIKKWNLSYRFEYWYWLVSYQSSYQKLSCHCWPSNRRQEACNVIKCLTGECILTAHFLQPTL